jgi:hypothetical protein
MNYTLFLRETAPSTSDPLPRQVVAMLEPDDSVTMIAMELRELVIWKGVLSAESVRDARAEYRRWRAGLSPGLQAKMDPDQVPPPVVDLCRSVAMEWHEHRESTGSFRR